MLIDGYGSPESMLNDRERILCFLTDTVENLNMHPISEPLVVEVGANNKKDPGGLSGFVMIAESHISIHTFPKRAFFSADIYTCNDDIDEVAIRDMCAEKFAATKLDSKVLIRGTEYPSENVY